MVGGTLPLCRPCEEYAGSGAYARAHAKFGGTVVSLSESNTSKRDALQKDFPEARIDDDAFNAPPASDTLGDGPSLYGGGFSCKMVAPNGRQLGLASKHADEMHLFVHRARASNASAVWFENVYALFTLGLFTVLVAALATKGTTPSYTLKLPDGVDSVEFIRSVDLLAPVTRARITGLFIRSDLMDGAPPLPPLRSAGTYDTPQSLGDYLDPRADADPARLLHGHFRRLSPTEQYRLAEHPRGPLVHAELTIGPDGPARYGSLVRLRGSHDSWSVRAVRGSVIDVIRNDRQHPRMYDNVPVANVSEHLVRTVPVVHPSSTAISPRTVGDVFANTVTEHPAFPGQAYMVTARESARMMGLTVPDGMSERDAQTLVGDAIELATAEAIALRNISYVRRLVGTTAPTHAPPPCAAAVVSNLMPPPRQRAAADGPATLMRGFKCDINLAHQMFSHASTANTRATAQHYRLRQGSDPLARCLCNSSANMQRQGTRRTSSSSEDRSASLTIHADLFGPVDTEGRGGVSYGLVAAVETYIRDGDDVRAGPDYPWARALAAKKNAKLAIHELVNELRAHGLHPRILVTDGGGEFSGNDAAELYRQLGMIHRPRPSESHADRAENMVKRVKMGIRAAMLQSGAPPSLWPDAMLCVLAGLQSQVHASDNISAHKALLRREPDISALIPFYSLVYAYDTTRPNSSMRPRGIPVRYLSPAPAYGIGALRISVRGSERIVRTAEYAGPPNLPYDARTLTLRDTPAPEGPLSDDDMHADGTPKGQTDSDDDSDDKASDDEAAAARYPSRSRNRPPAVPRGTVHAGGGLQHGAWRTSAAAIDIGLVNPIPAPSQPSSTYQMARLGPCLTAPEGYSCCAVGTDGAEHVHMTDGTPSRGTTGTMGIPEALQCPDRDKYVEAIAKEDLLDADNFPDNVPAMVLVDKKDVSTGAPICRTICVNLQKRGTESKPGKFKSRIVLDESDAHASRRPEDSSPTCLTSTLFLALSIACHFGWELVQFDVTGAYLLAPPRRLQYARFPRGWRFYLLARHGHLPYDPDQHLMRVNRNIYGATDAGLVWFDMFSEFLLDTLEFRRLPVDRCLFLLVQSGLRVVIVLYVDDMLVMGDTALKATVTARLRARFPLTEGGCDFLGLEIDNDTHAGTLTVRQTAYARALVRATGFEGSNPVATPLPTDFVASTPDSEVTQKEGAADASSLDFASVTGSIGWLATHCMPILLFAFSVFSVVCRPSKTDALAPRPAHRKALARTLRWIAANVDSGLTFHRRDRFYINPVVDASHGREPHATSTIQANSRSGGFILVGGTTVAAFSSRQRYTACSTFEAELYALVHVLRKLRTTRHLAEFMLGSRPPTSHVGCDNMAVVHALRKRDLTSRSRHVRVHLGFVYDMLDAGDVIVKYLNTQINPANGLTAAESRDRFARTMDAVTGRQPIAPKLSVSGVVSTTTSPS